MTFLHVRVQQSRQRSDGRRVWNCLHSRLRQPGNLSSHLLSLLLFLLLLLLLLLLKLLLLLLLDDLHLLWGLRRVLLHHLSWLLKAAV